MHGTNDADVFMRVCGVFRRRETDRRGEVAKGNQGTEQEGRSEKWKEARNWERRGR